MKDMKDYLDDAVELVNAVEYAASGQNPVDDPRVQGVDGRAVALELAARRLHALAMDTDLIREGDTVGVQARIMSEADQLADMLQVERLF